MPKTKRIPPEKMTPAQIRVSPPPRSAPNHSYVTGVAVLLVCASADGKELSRDEFRADVSSAKADPVAVDVLIHPDTEKVYGEVKSVGEGEVFTTPHAFRATREQLGTGAIDRYSGTAPTELPRPGRITMEPVDAFAPKPEPESEPEALGDETEGDNDEPLTLEVGSKVTTPDGEGELTGIEPGEGDTARVFVKIGKDEREYAGDQIKPAE